MLKVESLVSLSYFFIFNIHLDFENIVRSYLLSNSKQKGNTGNTKPSKE